MASKRRPRVALAALWDVVRRVVDTAGSPLWEDFLHGPGTQPRPPIHEQRRWYRFGAPDAPFPVWATFGKDATGRLVCTGLIAGLEPEGAPITSSGLRAAAHIPAMVQAVTRDDELQRLIFGDVVRQAPRHTSGRRGHPGRAGLPDEHYRIVLEEYRDAQRTHPRAPIQELRQRPRVRRLQPPELRRQPVPEGTIYRWLQTARRRFGEEQR